MWTTLFHSIHAIVTDYSSDDSTEYLFNPVEPCLVLQMKLALKI